MASIVPAFVKQAYSEIKAGQYGQALKTIISFGHWKGKVVSSVPENKPGQQPMTISSPTSPYSTDLLSRGVSTASASPSTGLKLQGLEQLKQNYQDALTKYNDEAGRVSPDEGALSEGFIRANSVLKDTQEAYLGGLQTEMMGFQNSIGDGGMASPSEKQDALTHADIAKHAMYMKLEEEYQRVLGNQYFSGF